MLYVRHESTHSWGLCTSTLPNKRGLCFATSWIALIFLVTECTEGPTFVHIFNHWRGSGAHFTHEQRCCLECYNGSSSTLFTMWRTAACVCWWHKCKIMHMWISPLQTQTCTHTQETLGLLFSNLLIYPCWLLWCKNIELNISYNMQ